MVEDAVEAIGFGRFQWKLSVLTGLAWVSKYLGTAPPVPQGPPAAKMSHSHISNTVIYSSTYNFCLNASQQSRCGVMAQVHAGRKVDMAGTPLEKQIGDSWLLSGEGFRCISLPRETDTEHTAVWDRQRATRHAR